MRSIKNCLAAAIFLMPVGVLATPLQDAIIPWYQSDMGAEDFPDLVNVDPPIPSVYFEVGGTPDDILEAGEWARHHSPLFRIDPDSSIKKGMEAMTLAALELLAKP